MTTFPSDFLFQLTADEKTEVVAHRDHLQKSEMFQGLAFAFAEHGAAQAAYKASTLATGRKAP